MSHMDPQGNYPPSYGYGPQQPYGRRSHPIETKPFFLTSEFVAAALAVAGIAITALSTEAFGAWRAWILITAVTVAYLLSRGIAKTGTRSTARDPREHLQWGSGSSGGDGARSEHRVAARRDSGSDGGSEHPTQVREREEEESRPLFG